MAKSQGRVSNMGTKRVGLARVEALIEALARDISWGGSTVHVGWKRNIIALTDAGAAEANRSALTAAESDSIITIPALTGGTQTLALPSPAAGLTYTFVMLDTAGEDFNVETDASAAKILAVIPKGDGDNTAISSGYDKIGFDENAVLGSSFSVTCISTTDATAWLAHDVIDGLAANVGSINVA